MKILIQRVSHASVTVEQECIGKIERGILLFVGIEKHDDESILLRMRDKVLAYRVFPDDEGKMNRNVQEINGGVLVISQFTLAANTHKGLRPSFSSAAAPDLAAELYQRFVELLQEKQNDIAMGSFGADMQVTLNNDGPVTFLLEM